MRKLFAGLILSFTTLLASGQNLHVVGLLGLTNYQGDLQEKKITTQGAQAAFGAGLLYEINDKLYLRGIFTYGKVTGHDKNGRLNKNRNLSFTSPIYEVQLGVEYDFFNLYETNGLTPYAFAGLAFYQFNPYAITETGQRVNLQPLGTEGQGFYLGRKKYSLAQMAIPFGGGIKFAVNENVRIRLEGGFRKLFTDYLDDVSTTFADRDELLVNNGQLAVDLAFRADELGQGAIYPVAGTRRGNPGSKDWYYFGGIAVSFRLPSDYGAHSGTPRLGCPVF
ncbi:MAG TPA: DUF6089 family protein [Ferruginibacter sp.]|nr:DUF6089 family protein [Ferruginibacter sp.]HMP21465.1 DUF6089 family protein [Ferruginibacter sp.]